MFLSSFHVSQMKHGIGIDGEGGLDLNEILQIWKSLNKTGQCEGIAISEEIRDSWAL